MALFLCAAAFLWSTPRATAWSTFLTATRYVDSATARSFSATAASNFFTAVFISDFRARLRMFRAFPMRSRFFADLIFGNVFPSFPNVALHGKTLYQMIPRNARGFRTFFRGNGATSPPERGTLQFRPRRFRHDPSVCFACTAALHSRFFIRLDRFTLRLCFRASISPHRRENRDFITAAFCLSADNTNPCLYTSLGLPAPASPTNPR